MEKIVILKTHKVVHIIDELLIFSNITYTNNYKRLGYSTVFIDEL